MNRIKRFFATFLACVMAFSSIGIVNAVNVFAYGENRPTYSQEITSITATPHPTESCPIPTLYDGEMITRDYLRSRVEEYLSKVTLTLHFKDGTTLETTSVLGDHITPAKNYVDYNTMENDDFLEYTYKYFIEDETYSNGARYDKTVKFDVPINQVVPADETHCTSIKIAPNLKLVVADFYAYGLTNDAKENLIKVFKSYYNGKFSNGSSHNKNFGILAKIEGTSDEIAINPEKLNINCEITEEAPKATKYASWDNAVVNYFKLRYTYNYGGFSGSYDCFGAQGGSIADGGIDLYSNGYPFADYSVTTPPTKTTYVEGQKFNKEGMVISATTFGSKEISLADDNNINNFDWEKSTFKPSTTYDLTSDSKIYQENRVLTTADTEMEVYYGFLSSGTDIFYTATVPIKVVPKEIVGIEVTNQPSKVSYIVGQTFDKNGMVVTATYNDGTTAPITNYVIEDNILKSGQNKVYVTYGDYYDTVDVSVADKEISSIAITTQPKKTSYVEGEKFDDEGMVVTATYNDGSKGVLKKYEYTYPATALTTGNKNVTVSAGNKTASVAVNVVANTITGIEVTYPPKKTEYIVGQAFATEGMRVTATYNDGSKAEISDYTYEPHIIEDNTKTITVSKSGKTATTPITVVNKAVTSIAVTKQPNKLSYNEGDTFNKAGMVVTATYNDGTSAPISDYVIVDNVLKSGQSKVYITYNNLYTTVDVTVKDTVILTGIKVTKQPSKVSYIAGDTFDNSGMEVKALYSDGTETAITNYECNKNPLSKGTNTVYITYNNFFATVNISVAEKAIASIEITTQPKKTSYVEGEKFDDRGMIVTATYSDGTHSDLAPSEYTYSLAPLTINDSSITISAGNKTASVNISVVAKELTKIEVTYPPKKTEYIVGQTFLTEGMHIMATYNDGTEVEVFDYTYSPHTIADNTREITISKSGKNASVPVTVVEKAVTSIAVTHQPSKLIYNEGDIFNVSGMIVTATYNDRTTAPITNYVIEDNVLKSGQSKVYITYNNLYTTVDVTVKDTVILTGIKVTKQPSKVSYIAGDTFDNSGMEVKALYSDGTENVINDYDYSRSPLSGGSNKIYITYKNFFATVDISVAEKAITSITVTTQPKKTNYVEGEVFNDYGMVVMATYSDGTRSALAPSEYTFSSAPLTLSDKNITISAGSKTTSVSITVVEKVISYINITKEPDKIDYIVGQHFDDTGMIVTAHYNDGTESEIRDYTFSPDVITADTDKITVTKDSKTDIVRITVTEKLMTSIAVTKPPKKTTYIENDVFDKTGMVITATYNDGTQTEVKDYVVDSNRLSVGTDKVYITYNGLYTTTPINVIAKSITEIEIITPPSKVNYVEGESFDRTGMVVKAKYDDGSTGILESYEIIPDTSLTVYDSIITVRKDGKTDTTPITVVHKEVVGIKVTRQPDKVEYTEGEIFDVEGMVVTAYYNDNSSSEISDYTYSEEPFKAGDMYVTIEYKGFYDIVPITLAIKDLNSFIKERNGDVNRDGAVDLTDAGILTKYLGKVTDFAKKAVHTGDTDNDGNLTNDDIVLINNYINGNANLSEAALINADINGDGIVSEVDTDLINKAVLNMWDMDTVYELNADANDDGDINMLDVIWILNTHYRHTTIDHIEIVKAPEKTQYVEGQYFDDNGMTVEAVYKDNTREVVTDYTYPERPLEITDTAVEINFEEHKAEQPVTVIKRVIFGGEEDNGNSDATTEKASEQTTSDNIGEQTTKNDSEQTTENSSEQTTSAVSGDISTETTTEKNYGNSEGIRIINLPDKTNYVEGQIFDPAGILIEVLWNDGTKTYIDENGVYVSDIPLTLSDIYGVVYYEYKNGTEKINVPITVIARKAVSAKVVEYPRTEYTEGEEFDKNGAVVEVTYNDGSKETVKDEDIVVKDNKPLTQEDTKVTVVADGVEADIDITVSARETTTETTTSSGNHSGGGAGRKPKTEITTESTTGDAKDKTDIKSETDTKTEFDTEKDTKSEKDTERGIGNTDSGDSEFDDISDHWAEDYIEYLHDKGIFKGVTDDLFMPDISTKRGDFALVLDRMLELDNITSVDALDFTDVPADSYYAEAIANCSRSDLFIGYGNGEFKPEKAITREEMFVIIAKLNNTDIDRVDLSVLDDFADGHTVSEWAKPYTAALVEAGIIVGDNGNINPSAEITRAEMATIIYNYITQ